MTAGMYGQPITNVNPFGQSPFSFSPQLQPYMQSQQQIPFGHAMGHPFAQQSSGMPLQQIAQMLAQQLAQLNQYEQQQAQLLQQLIQVVPQQLHQIHQLLQYLPQVIQQSQMHQQPFGQTGAFGQWQQPFGGSSSWAGAGTPQQSATGGQPGPGGNIGFPMSGGQPGLVM